jgi:hypothetical protein
MVVIQVLEELLARSDVTTFIEDVQKIEKYYTKRSEKFSTSFYVSKELALFIFYDALLKFKIILNDIYLFDEYLAQIEKLYKKLTSFDDVEIGINKLICKMVSVKLSIHDMNDPISRKTIISYIYNKYIVDGYFIHGFNSSYAKSIKEDGFIPEIYSNYYADFIEVNKIFAKYNVINIIEKDFSNIKVYFTDDFVSSCYYSIYSPMFFYKFLNNTEYFGKGIRQDGFLKDDYNLSISHLKRFMSNNMFSDTDKKFILNVVSKQWALLHRGKRNISLMLVKRKRIYNKESIKLDDILNDTSDIYEVVDRLLNSKHKNINYNDFLNSEDFEIINLEYNIDNKNNNYIEVSNLDDAYLYKEEEVGTDFLNVYGKASIFILLGSIFISLGVIITIFMIVRGI